MRKKQYLNLAHLPVKEYDVKDFKKITDYATNVEVGEQIKTPHMTGQYVSNLSALMVKTFFVGDRYFAYLKNKNIYERTSAFRFYIAQSNVTDPLMVEVILNGKKEVLIIESSKAFIMGKNTTFKFPHGTSAGKYDGRIFVSKLKNIYYSNKFNFDTVSTDIVNEGFLSVESEDEMIFELVSFTDCLYAVCEKGIYKLTINDGEFNFKRCEVEPITIMNGSIKKIGKDIYFISDNRLCVFDGNTVKVISGEFDRYLPYVKENASTANGFYMIKTVMNGEEVFFLYDTFTGKHHYVWIEERGSLGENGSMFSSEYYGFYDICYNTDTKIFRWCSKELDFSCPHKKSLLELSLCVDQPMSIYVKGDFGTKKLELEKGLNVKKLNLTSSTFKFTTMVVSENILIKDMKFKYRILGE